MTATACMYTTPCSVCALYFVRRLERLSLTYHNMPSRTLLKACLCAGIVGAGIAAAELVDGDGASDPLVACPGYRLSNVETSWSGLTANLTLAGPACNVYGDDLEHLTLTVSYETGECLSQRFVRVWTSRRRHDLWPVTRAELT